MQKAGNCASNAIFATGSDFPAFVLCRMEQPIFDFTDAQLTADTARNGTLHLVIGSDGISLLATDAFGRASTRARMPGGKPGSDDMAKVFVAQRKARPFWFGHPWVFSGAIDRGRGKVKDGDIVDLSDH